MLEGYLDRADRDYVVGWAFDTDAPDQPVELIIEVNGEERWQGFADNFRRDLQEAGMGNGNHGLAVAVGHLGILPTGEFQINVRVKGVDESLPGAPRLLPAVTLEEAPKSAPKPSADIIGNLDEVTHAVIRGWAFDRGRPGMPVSVDLFVDGRFVVRADADQFRADLFKAGFGEGLCGFFFAAPINVLDGRSHRIQVIPTNHSDDLGSSPKDVLLDGITPVHHVAHLQSKLTAMLDQVRRSASQFQVEAANVASAGKATSLYRKWYDTYAVLTVERRNDILRSIMGMTHAPLISILVPVYNTEPHMLRAMIESVRGQLYPHWQLCIADDCSTRKETRRILEEYARLDVRVRVTFRESNGHISEATNTVLNQASGEYIALLDHDDELTEDALYHIAVAINETGADLIYSDEDKMDTRKALFDPHFKPAFNYTLLLSYNYICHLVVVRRELAVGIGGFRTETNGAQDYDFLLRLCERLDHDKIVHVPHVLYHWRAHEASTALDTGVKSYVDEAAKRALSDHVSATGVSGATVTATSGFYRVEWPMPAPAPRVSIIIPTRDCADVLSLCLVGLLNRTDYPDLEVIIIDNGSVEDATAALFKEAKKDERVRIFPYDREFNYSAICNFGATHATGNLLLMMNNDVEVTDDNGGWLKEMVSQVSRPGVGAVGAKLLYPNGKVQHAGVILGLGGPGGVAGHSHKYYNGADAGYFNRLRVPQELSGCTAACLIIRRDVFDKLEGFDEKNLPVSFNDVDLCLRIREAGWAIVYTPYATLIHHESYSRGAENTPAKIVRSQREVAYMHSRWGVALEQDPSYNPSLTLDQEDFAMDLRRGTAFAAGGRTRRLTSRSISRDSESPYYEDGRPISKASEGQLAG